jgi:hypothetical protein
MGILKKLALNKMIYVIFSPVLAKLESDTAADNDHNNI